MKFLSSLVHHSIQPARQMTNHLGQHHTDTQGFIGEIHPPFTQVTSDITMSQTAQDQQTTTALDTTTQNSFTDKNTTTTAVTTEANQQQFLTAAIQNSPAEKSVSSENVKAQIPAINNTHEQDEPSMPHPEQIPGNIVQQSEKNTSKTKAQKNKLLPKISKQQHNKSNTIIDQELTNASISSTRSFIKKPLSVSEHDSITTYKTKQNNTDVTIPQNLDIENKEKISTSKTAAIKLPTMGNKSKISDSQKNEKISDKAQKQQSSYIVEAHRSKQPPRFTPKVQPAKETPQVRIGHINVLIEDQSQVKQKPVTANKASTASPFGIRGL